MLKYFTKLAWRNLNRHRGYSLINVFGLAVGLACCLMIALYVRDELSFDRFHTHGNRIYRVLYSVRHGEDLPAPAPNEFRAWGSAPVGPALEADFPEVIRSVRFSGRHYVLMARDDRIFQEENYFFVDESVFEVFSFPLKRGNPKTALFEPYSVVLSESAAKRYFGDEDPMGQTMLFQNESPLTVTGILFDPPDNSHIDFDILISIRTAQDRWVDDFKFTSWGYVDFFTYVLLPEDYPVEQLEEKMPAFIERYVELESTTSFNIKFESIRNAYFSPVSGFLPGPSGQKQNLYIFSLIALFILIIACINFMNLSTARSLERAREVGVRKAVGAGRGSLIRQFLMESIILSLIAMVLALLLVELSMPVFRQLSGKVLSDRVLHDPLLLGFGFVCALLVGLLAGSYPAFVLARFVPVNVLKGSILSSPASMLIRKGLVVFQFAISAALIAGTVIVYSQLRYMQNQHLGFNKEQMLLIDFGGDREVRWQIETIKEEMATHPDVLSVSATRSVPGSYFPQAGNQIENIAGEMESNSFDIFEVDYDFIPHFGLEMAAGRPYRRDFPTDLQEALVINESAARTLGYASANDAIGRQFLQWGREGQIIGVVRDFNYVSLHRPIEPLTLSLNPGQARFFALRLNTENFTDTMAEIERIWRRLAPHRPFLYSFLDEAFDRQYRSEVQFGRLFRVFAGLAVIIACLGLFGLVSYSTSQRTKEIGVRKVMGASITNIFILLSKDFVRLVLIAFVIACPVIYLVMNQWLDGFAYQTHVGAGIYISVGGLVLLISLFTVSYQAIKSASANPVDTLRYE